jgi:hypothetical protein
VFVAPPPVGLPVTSPAPAVKSDIPVENAAYMLPGMCPDAGLPPVVVSLQRGTPGARPEYKAAIPARQMVDRVWAARARLSGVCLEYAAYAAAKLGQEDRALRLFAVGNVREAYDRARCAPDTRRDYSSYADMHGIATAMLGMDVDLFRRRRAEAVSLTQAAVRDEATWRYTADLSRVCDLSTPLPEADWPAARAKVVAATLSATATPTKPAPVSPTPSSVPPP